MPIRVLSPELRRLIAAGEVVSRPLDVVRELIDNALDAQATRIEVQLTGGGLQLIEVRDNGRGIPAEQLPLAAVRHATSKLGTGRPPEGQPSEGTDEASTNGASTLDNIQTLGFRGEALWAAAQAGELHITSRPAAQLGATQLQARGAEQTLQKVSAAAGTTARVTGLFAELPARLRTQLPAATENRDVSALVSRYMLHHPQLHWKLVLDGETKLLHAPSDTRGAVASAYGPVTANRTLNIQTPNLQTPNLQTPNLQTPNLQTQWLRGVISRPELSRARRDRMFFSVNGRPITPPAELENAVIAAYSELLSAGHAPLCVLDLTLSAHDINPNIHPAKSVVAIAELASVCQRLTQALQEQLAGTTLARPLPALRVSENTPPTHTSFPTLNLLGVYRETYLLAEGEGDLWVIDAHAAHERVMFEQLQAQLRALPTFELPQPELLQLGAAQLACLQERQAELSSWGLVIEEFGAGLARLRSLPAALARLPVARLHEQILETALAAGTLAGETEREVLSRLACAPALKAGMLGNENGAAVLALLAQCSQPWSCPHGRPTVLRLSERDLAHGFGRRAARDLPNMRDQRDGTAAAQTPSSFSQVKAY